MYIGGLIGRVNNSIETLQNSYNTGTVTGDYYVGGLVGVVDDGITSFINNVSLPISTIGNTNTNRLVVYGTTSGSNNYGYVATSSSGTDYIPFEADLGNGPNGKNANCTDFSFADWWQNIANFNSNDWEFKDGFLPKLKNINNDWQAVNLCYTVSFNTGGGSSVDNQYTNKHINDIKAETTTKPLAPVKEGWTFDNWYDSQSFENVFDFSTPITTDTSLFAKWTQNPTPEPTPEPQPSPTPATSTKVTKIYTPITRIGIKKSTKIKVPLYVYANVNGVENIKLTAKFKQSNKKIKILKKTKKHIYTNKENFIYIKGVKYGKAKVTITAGGKREVLNISITKTLMRPIKPKVKLTKKAINSGKYSYVKIYFKHNAQYKKPVFKTSNKRIVTVDKAGRIKASASGKVTITTKWYGRTYKNRLKVL
jgi:uncharacterized repeat protein (TIGR02543 family)